MLTSTQLVFWLAKSDELELRNVTWLWSHLVRFRLICWEWKSGTWPSPKKILARPRQLAAACTKLKFSLRVFFFSISCLEFGNKPLRRHLHTILCAVRSSYRHDAVAEYVLTNVWMWSCLAIKHMLQIVAMRRNVYSLIVLLDLQMPKRFFIFYYGLQLPSNDDGPGWFKFGNSTPGLHVDFMWTAVLT